jgi:hypothetical protein
MSSLAELPDPTGFFSYSRQDDEHSKGALSRLRAQIYDELRLQLGKNFKLWQDIEAISEGTEWEDEIKRAISESVFFIPIVTPSSVASKHCHLEFQAFLDREKVLGRKNLVFPLLYIRVPALEKEELWRQDPVLGIIGRRQYFDWQKFRHRAPNDTEVAQRIAQFCENIVQSLRQPWVSPKERGAAEAEAKRIAEQARLDEKERQLVEAEAWQRAEEQRRATEAAKTRRNAEDSQTEQERRTAKEVSENGLLSPIAKRALIATLVGTAVLLFVAQSFFFTLSEPANPPTPTPTKMSPLFDVPGCRSFRMVNGGDGRNVVILSDESPENRSAAKSAGKTVEQNGYNVLNYIHYPVSTTDFSSYLLESQSGKAEILVNCAALSGLLEAQAKQFGVILK